MVKFLSGHCRKLHGKCPLASCYFDHTPPYLLVSGDGSLVFSVVGAPDLDGLVSCRAGQPLAVRAELDGGDSLGVSHQRELQAVVGPQGLW